MKSQIVFLGAKAPLHPISNGGGGGGGGGGEGGGHGGPALAEINIMQYFANKTRLFFSDFKDMVIWQLLVKKKLNFFFGGGPYI